MMNGIFINEYVLIVMIIIDKVNIMDVKMVAESLLPNCCGISIAFY